MPSPVKSYLAEFGTAMGAYVVLLPTCIETIDRMPDSPWRFALALVPVVPLVFVLVAMLRFFSRADELERKIHLDAVATACGVTAIATFAYGMLETVGLPSMNLVLVMPFMIAVWGTSAGIASWRYR